ncbi:MAG: ABC transporter permease, partial [Acidobacteriota bacterium]
MGISQWRFTIPLKLRSILRGGRMERELDEELRFHLDSRIEEGVARGLSPRQARAAAMRAMGGLEQRKEEMRDARGIHWLTDFVDDARYAIRSLRRTPGLALFVVLTLSLGIGLTAAPFSMADALIFRPYPVPDSAAVVSLVSTTRDDAFDAFSYREYLDIRDRTTSYDGVVASGGTTAVGFAAEPGATPRVRGGMLVSGNYFQALGVEPQLGRGFRPGEDEVPGRDAVAVLGPDFWTREFAGNPAVVGRTIRLNGTDFTVVGVAPGSFPGMQIFSRPDVYMPLAMAGTFSTDPQKRFFEDRDDRELSVKARLRPGVTRQQAQNELGVLAQDFARQYPQHSRDRGAAVHTQFEMRTRGDDGNWKFSVIFTTLALAVLLVACTNVAGLLLSRARSRTREIALRLALGAGRLRLVRLLLTESLILASLGGLGGLAIGYAGIRFLGTFRIPSELPVTIPFRMDTRVLLASLVLSMVSALACGLAPALQSTRLNLVEGLKSADGNQTGRRLRARNLLVVAQVATSLMLLTAAFLMVRGFERSFLQGTAFKREHLLMARLDPRLVQYTPAETQQFYRLLSERVRATAGVQSTGLTANPPLGLDDFDRAAFVPEGIEMPRDRDHVSAMMDTVDDGYFDTMGIPILRGRGFRDSDTADAPRVAVVNDQFAGHYWPNDEAVGRRIRLGDRAGTPVEIVGVAQSIKYRDTAEGPIDFLYLPL